MYACMTPVGFDTSDKFENHCSKILGVVYCNAQHMLLFLALCFSLITSVFKLFYFS